jgi:hypothetical protein
MGGYTRSRSRAGFSGWSLLPAAHVACHLPHTAGAGGLTGARKVPRRKIWRSIGTWRLIRYVLGAKWQAGRESSKNKKPLRRCFRRAKLIMDFATSECYLMGELYRSLVMRTGEDRARRSPAHAGRLPPWQRMTIIVVLAALAAGIGAAVMSSSSQPAGAAHAGDRKPGPHQGAHAGPAGTSQAARTRR